MKLVKNLVAIAGISLVFNAANAGSIDISSEPVLEAIAKDIGAAISYKAISPAEPLGLIGFDIGVEASFTQLESATEIKEAFDTSMSTLPLLKIHAHKGLPFGIDVGAVYSQVPSTDIQFVGGEIRYSFVSGNLAIPAIGVRGTYTRIIGIDELDLSTKGVELTVSKGFLLLTPYLGVGQVWASASGEPRTGDVTWKSDPSMSKYFGGLNIALGLMNIVVEADKTGDAMTYSTKLGFRF